MNAELLREAIRAAETHEWTRNQLMADKDGRVVFVSFMEAPLVPTPTLMARRADRMPEAIECDQVAACCAVGFLRFADVCLLPVSGESGSDALQAQLEQFLWSKPEVREACRRGLRDEYGDEIADIDEFIEENGLESIGEEGLLPFWNDTIAESKDEVIALFTEALESITPA